MQAIDPDKNVLMTGRDLLIRLLWFKKLKLFKKIKVRMIYKSEVERIKKYGDRFR